jgi:hypothetical protein
MFSEARRFWDLPAAAYRGSTSPYPFELYLTINKKIEVKGKHDYALDENQIIRDLFEVNRRKNVQIGDLPYKAQALAFHACFTDALKRNVGINIEGSYGAKFVSELLYNYHETNEPITIPEQYELALDICHDNLSNAAKVLAVVTRHMSRAQDHTAFSFAVNRSLMIDYKKATADMLFDSDTAGDNYHFWGGFLVGVSRRDNADLYSRITGKITDTIVKNVPEITNLLRYKLFKNDGITHMTDELGYECGRAVLDDLSAFESGIWEENIKE